jgi:hypothetical protein
MQISRAVCCGLFLGLSISLFAADAHGASGRDKITAKPPPAAPAPPKPSGATIYFIRGPGMKGFWVPGVIFDDQKIGELPPDSVFVVSRPTGHHTIDVPGSFLGGNLHSEIDVTAGETFYLEFALYSEAPGTQALMALMSGGAGARGKMLPGSGILNMRFYLLDAELGRELIAKIKNAAP